MFDLVSCEIILWENDWWNMKLMRENTHSGLTTENKKY